MEVLYVRTSKEVKDSLRESAKKRNVSLSAYCNLLFYQHKKIMDDIEKIGGQND